jgi:hypothetical protein
LGTETNGAPESILGCFREIINPFNFMYGWFKEAMYLNFAVRQKIYRYAYRQIFAKVSNSTFTNASLVSYDDGGKYHAMAQEGR